MHKVLAWTVALGFIACGGGSGDDDDSVGADATPEVVPSWAVLFGADRDDRGMRVAVGPSGDVYLAGRFYGEVVLGAGQEGETRLTSIAFVDQVVARYSADGTLRWARRAGGAVDDIPYALGVGDDGSVYVAGVMSAQATFSGPDGMTDIASSGTDGPDNMALLRIDADGSLQWSRRAGLVGTTASDLAVDADESVVLGGSFLGTAVFGEGEPEEVEFHANVQDMFVARYMSDGSLAFAIEAGELDRVSIKEIEIGSSGDITAVGTFHGAFTLAAGTPQAVTLTSSSSDEEGVFVARFDPNGVLQWAAGVSGASTSAGGLAVGDDGSATITGAFRVVAKFDEGGPRAITIDRIGGPEANDMFVARYDSDGSFEWARNGVGTPQVYGLEVLRVGGGEVLVLGGIDGTATFDDRTLSSTSNDVYAVGYDEDGAVISAEMIATGSGDEILHDATRASNGDLVMTGYVRDTANFDLGDREVSVSAVGEADGFVVRRKP